MHHATRIPQIDMRLFDAKHSDPALRDVCRQKFVREFGQALEKFGFVIIEEHGIDRRLLARAYDVAGRVFDLPVETKKRYETPDNGRQTGYTSFGIEHAKDDPHPDLKEFWHVYRPGHPTPNLFPSETPEFEATCLELYAALDGLSMRLLEALGLYLGKPSGNFPGMAEGGNTLLRLLNYPEIEPGWTGIRSAAHEDINLITLLVAATASGLEVKTRAGEWIPVDNPPDSIIVNAGDMLQMHTFGRIPSTTHRVVNLPGRRLSIPFFVHPRGDVPLVMAGDYLLHRLREIGLKV